MSKIRHIDAMDSDSKLKRKLIRIYRRFETRMTNAKRLKKAKSFAYGYCPCRGYKVKAPTYTKQYETVEVPEETKETISTYPFVDYKGNDRVLRIVDRTVIPAHKEKRLIKKTLVEKPERAVKIYKSRKSAKFWNWLENKKIRRLKETYNRGRYRKVNFMHYREHNFEDNLS